MTRTVATPLLLRLAGTYEIRIETRDSLEAPAHRTIIWVVVDEDGAAVYVRSVRGDLSHWYRRLIANPQGSILVADDRIPVTAVPVLLSEIELVSELLKRKYPPDQHLFAILRSHVVSATLRLEPR